MNLITHFLRETFEDVISSALKSGNLRASAANLAQVTGIASLIDKSNSHQTP